MNAASTASPGEGEKPLFYRTIMVPADETMRLLAEQRRPKTGSEEVVFSCSGQCFKCLHQGCKNLEN